MKPDINRALSAKIENSFNNIQIEYKDEYWTRFQEKMGKPNSNVKRLSIAMFMAKVAAIVLFFSILPKKTNFIQVSPQVKYYSAQTERIENQTIKKLPPVFSTQKLAVSRHSNRSEEALFERIETRKISLETNENREINPISIQTNQAQLFNKSLEYFAENDENIMPSVKSNHLKKFRIAVNLLGSTSNVQNKTSQQVGVGILAGIRLSDKLKIHSGIALNKMNTDETHSYFLAVDKLNEVKINTTENIDYLSLPFGMSVALNSKLSVGIESQFSYIKNRSETRQAGISTVSTSGKFSTNRTQYFEVANTLQNKSQVQKFEAIRTLKFRPDGKILASGSEGRNICLWSPNKW